MNELPNVNIEDLPDVQVRDSDNEEWMEAKHAYTSPDCIKTLFPYLVFIKKESGEWGETWRSQMRLKPQPKMRLMTHAEIFKAIAKGACVKFMMQGNFTWVNVWNTDCNPADYEISYDGGETAESMEVEE